MATEPLPIDEIFWHASQLASPDERARYLDRACHGNEALRRRLDRLLELQPDAERFLEVAEPTWPMIDDESSEQPGMVIGNYRLLEQIGHGGMGVVFMAEQSQPVRRKVALKILKPGMDTEEILGRFEQERQALAIMDHPHITRVFDAGTTPAGRPYFVMELVRGVSITKFCEQQRLNGQQRLRLLVQVCYAVQHAHQKGIIHRDLKPSNVMVELHDVTPVPKVIDFGVAKATLQRLIDRTLFTGFVQMIGTPLYMSPEQAEFNALDVDTRSDVYSLGVLLYELITGGTPFERERIRDAGYDELQRIIRDEEPPRPSTRISTLNASGQAAVSQTIDSRNPGFVKRLRNELDWVVMKALEKDRTRRYQSASELAADIQRFLDDEPVLARAPSLTYRLTKLARRNKAALTMFVAVTAALLLGTAVSLWQAWRATDAQQLAEHRAVIAERAVANAKMQEARADAARRQSDQRLYVADMKLASDAIRGGDIPRAATLLEQHRPDTDCPTMPGFEWRYLNRLIDVRPNWQTNIGVWARCVRLSPDGTLLAIAARDGSVQIRDAKTGKVLQRFGSLSETNSVAWSPDGRRIVSASEDGGVRLWNVEAFAAAESSLLSNLVSSLTDRPAQVINAYEGAANDVIFTPDAGTLITAGDDGQIGLWNVETGEALATLTGHSREVEQLAVSPDGTLLASSSSDDTVIVWDFKSRKQRFAHASLKNPGRMVCVSFSTDGSLVAAGDINGNLLVGDVESETWTQAELVDGIESVAFLNNPLRVITGDRGGSVQLWELKHEPGTAPKISDTPRTRWIAHQGRVQGLAVNPRDEMIVTGSRDSTVAAWSVGVSTPAWQWAQSMDFCVVSDDEMIVCDREVLLVDLRTRKLIDAFLPSESGWHLIVESRDTPRIAVAGEHTIVVYDLATKHEILRQEFELQVYRLAISPDGSQLAVAWWDERMTIDLFDLTEGADPSRNKALRPLGENGGQRSDEGTLVDNGGPHPFERRGDSRRSFQARQCRALKFSPDNRRLAVGHMDDVLAYDVSGTEFDTTATRHESGVPVWHLTGHDSTLTDVAFSLDGTLLATVSHDRHLMLWNADTRKQIASVPAHHAEVNSVTFSADGRTIATTGDDGAVRLWRTATLQPLLEVWLPADRKGERVELTADGSRLLLRTNDNRIIVHDAEIPQLPEFRAGGGDPSDQTFHFHGLGDLPGGEFYSNATGLSSDGRIVVGYSNTAHGFDLFRWIESDGIQRIGPPRPRVANTEAGAVSDDGNVICGAGTMADRRGYSALLWANPDSVVRIKSGESAAQDISADGAVVVGRQRIDQTWTAFRWTADGLIRLQPTPEHHHSETAAVTRDGARVLGTMFNHPDTPSYRFEDFRRWQDAQPVIWEGDETRPLAGFGPGFNWHASDLSDDGKIVTGVRWPHGEHRNGLGSRAFVWQEGEVTLLEPLPGCQTTAAAGVSGDGRTIVGTSEYLRSTNWQPVACIWDADHGMRDLQQWLARKGVALNWRLQHSRAISRDGSTIIGVGINPQGHQESWRLRVPDGVFGP